MPTLTAVSLKAAPRHGASWSDANYQTSSWEPAGLTSSLKINHTLPTKARIHDTEIPVRITENSSEAKANVQDSRRGSRSQWSQMMDSWTFRTVSYRYLCSSQMPAVHLDSFSTLCKNENAGIGCIPVLLILCVPVSTKHTMQSALCLHRVSWADPANERQTCLWPPVPQIVSEVMPLFTYLSALSLSFLFSSSLSLFVETSMQPCPLCRKLSGAAVSL